MDAEQIADSLSEAQREWVLSPEREVFEVTGWHSGDEPEWDELARIGVSDFYTDRLTPLGLEVRKALLERDGGGR